ncbi:MAG: NB-ARC domain-containing protein [Cyanobacteria bacterium P01_F01_bin.56]
MHARFEQHDRAEISVVSGMGGAGKTELSLQYALTNQQAYPGGICWIEARKKNISSQIVSFAKTRFNLIPPEELEDHREKVQWCWQNWPEGKTLIIFNDVNSYVYVKSYLPPAGASFCILLTTRLKFRNESERLELNVLQPEDAFLLLELLVGKERVKAETNVAQEICRWLGYLPLGLELVSRYLARRQELTLTEILARLNNQRLEHRALKKPGIESDMTAELGVAAAFELSWNELNSLAQEIGYLLSIFDIVPIDWSVVEQYFCKTDLEELEDAQDEQLLELHLLQRESNRVYRLHELVREFFQAKLIENSEYNLQKAITTRIAKITKQGPFKIIEILNEKLLDWQWSNDILQPPALEIGEFLLIAQQAWSEGIGPLSQLILEHQIDGKSPPIAIPGLVRYT